MKTNLVINQNQPVTYHLKMDSHRSPIHAPLTYLMRMASYSIQTFFGHCIHLFGQLNSLDIKFEKQTFGLPIGHCNWINIPTTGQSQTFMYFYSHCFFFGIVYNLRAYILDATLIFLLLTRLLQAFSDLRTFCACMFYFCNSYLGPFRTVHLRTFRVCM